MTTANIDSARTVMQRWHVKNCGTSVVYLWRNCREPHCVEMSEALHDSYSLVNG